ncbi:TPA: hypothetical protein DIV49_00215 [Candidatus Saccharibacteria bacterium]|nr:hypothetical protein [Candidatus Saccharibacteria bacterium]HRJ91402.1 hypothetical protein [Candidatus Saccharibacteria bacterium]
MSIKSQRIEPEDFATVFTFWPDTEEHESVKAEYVDRVTKAVAELPRLAALLEMLQEVAVISVDKRVEKATAIAQEKAYNIPDRDVAMSSALIRLLQLHDDQDAARRAVYFKGAEQLPSAEIAARVRVGERKLINDELVRVCLEQLSTASTGMRNSDSFRHDTGIKVVRTFGTSQHPTHAVLTTNTRYRTQFHGSEKYSPLIRVHSRQAGLLRIDRDELTPEEHTAIRLLANIRENVPYGDADYEPFRQRVMDIVARDAERSDTEEPMIYPVTESVFFSRRQRSNF